MFHGYNSSDKYLTMIYSVLQLRRREALRWAVRYLGYVSLWVTILAIIYAYPFVPSWYAWLFDPSYRPQLSIPVLPLINQLKANAIAIFSLFGNFLRSFWWKKSKTIVYDPLVTELASIFSSSSCGFPNDLTNERSLKTMTSTSLAILLTQDLGVQRIEDLFLLTLEDITEKLRLPIIQQRKFVSCLCKVQSMNNEGITTSSGLCQSI